MPKLIILRGNSGSGKTAAAGMLQEKFGPNTMRISHDMVRMEILHVWSKEGIERSLPLMVELMRYGYKNSEFTVMEGILPYSAYKTLFDTAVEEYGRKNIFAYYTIFHLRRHSAATRQSRIRMTSVRRICEGGGRRRTIWAI